MKPTQKEIDNALKCQSNYGSHPKSDRIMIENRPILSLDILAQAYRHEKAGRESLEKELVIEKDKTSYTLRELAKLEPFLHDIIDAL